MSKINIKFDFKDKRVYIPCIIIGILLLFLILFGVSNLVSNISGKEKFTSNVKSAEFKDELGEDSSRKSVVVKANTNEKCNSKNICVESVNILCYNDRGVIEFKVVNNSSSNSDGGYLNLKIGNNYNAVIWYDAVESGKSVEGFHSYDGYDLRNASKNSYSVSDLSDNDKSSIVSFIYYDCISPREYYPINYEGKRIYNDGDADYKHNVECISKNDASKRIVSYSFDPCASSTKEDGVINGGVCQIVSDCAKDSNGKCSFNQSGGDNSNNSCVKYTVSEEKKDENGNIVYDENNNTIMVLNDYCGEKDLNGYINHNNNTGSNIRVKCQSYSLCTNEGCYPFCEDLNIIND